MHVMWVTWWRKGQLSGEGGERGKDGEMGECGPWPSLRAVFQLCPCPCCQLPVLVSVVYPDSCISSGSGCKSCSCSYPSSVDNSPDGKLVGCGSSYLDRVGQTLSAAALELGHLPVL